ISKTQRGGFVLDTIKLKIPVFGSLLDQSILNKFCKTFGILIGAGVHPSRIVADPGIGFGKTLEHNLALLSSGRDIVPDSQMGLMWGVSRKSMFRDLVGRDDSHDRLAGTLGVAAVSKEKGVDIIRVHDVAEHSDVFSAMKAVR
ncbi:MAG: dihydropteroate synthase, partial [Candidatus Thalassarchaeaceae archaeon]|nr:dihydropteroate synthase [Candidatus Thalassarchaeaceae archaeon]